MNQFEANEEVLDLYNRIEYYLGPNLVYFNIYPLKGLPGDTKEGKAGHCFEKCGFKPMGKSWFKPGESQARDWTAFVLQWSLQYQEEFMSPGRGHGLADTFYDIAGASPALFCTAEIDLENKHLLESHPFLPDPHREGYQWGMALIADESCLVMAICYPEIY